MRPHQVDRRVLSFALAAALACVAGCGSDENTAQNGASTDAGSTTEQDAGGTLGFDSGTAADSGVSASDAGADAGDAASAVVATGYVFDQEDRLLGEYDEDGNTLQELIYVGNRLVAVVRDGKIHAVQTDQLGAPRAVLSGGKTVWRWDPEPFGATAPDEDVDGDGTSFVLHERFPGQRLDPVSRLHQNFHRNYAPELGRYVEADPLGLAGGANLYAYAAGRPTMLVDPLGLSPTVRQRSKAFCERLKRLVSLEQRLGGPDAYAWHVLPWGDGRLLGTIMDGNAAGMGQSTTVDGVDFNYLETAYSGRQQGLPGGLGSIAYSFMGLVINAGAAVANAAGQGRTPTSKELGDVYAEFLEDVQGAREGATAAGYPSLADYYAAVCRCPQ